jgi:hypothetical protein
METWEIKNKMYLDKQFILRIYTQNIDVRETLIHPLPTVRRMDKAAETAYTIFSPPCSCVVGQDLKFL